MNCVECGCDGTPTSLYDVPIVISTAAPTIDPTLPCVIDDPDSQYCFTVPESYYYDYYDHYEAYYGEWMERINAGDTVKFSKVCSDKWYRPGTEYEDENGQPRIRCEDITYCDYYWDILLMRSVPTDNGLITSLNCPQCGCTLGSNDAITLIERQAGIRSTAGDAVHRPNNFEKALAKKKAFKNHLKHNSAN